MPLPRTSLSTRTLSKSSSSRTRRPTRKRNSVASLFWTETGTCRSTAWPWKANEKGRERRSRPMSLALFRAQVQRGRQLEAQGCLRRQHDVLVAGEGRTRRAGASTGNGADGRAFAAACQASNQSAQTGAAPNHGRGALAFSLGGFGECRGLDGVIHAVHGDGFQPQGECGPALESAQRLGIGDGAAGR